MRINHYRTKLDDNGVTIMLREGHNYGGQVQLNRPDLVFRFCTDYLEMQREAEEYVYCLCFSTSNRLIGMFEVSHGTNNTSLCGPREIFQKALLCNAAGIIIVHNHPSGDPTPSRSDLENAQRLKSAGELIGVKLVDSIVVGNNSYVSLSEDI